MEIIRDAITHPISTISDTIQNVLSTSAAEPEVNAQAVESTTVIDEDENKDEKTTLETIREVITHPISAISEKIQHVLSPSTHDEQVEETASETRQSSPPPSSEQTSTVRRAIESSLDRLIADRI